MYVILRYFQTFFLLFDYVIEVIVKQYCIKFDDSVINRTICNICVMFCLFNRTANRYNYMNY
jgi:hypothetical protein